VEHADAAELRGSEDSQAHKLEILGRLAGGVAHDFANLLTLIAGYSELLLSGMGASDPGLAELEEIRRAAARGARMTAQILDFIRSLPAQVTTLDLNSLVVEVEKLLRPLIGEHITLTTDLSPDSGSIEADAVQMTRVIMNLVLNARDAMPHGGRITVRTGGLRLAPGAWPGLAPGRTVVLEVADNGPGIEAATRSRLFQAFFTRKKQGRGTGLGLSTVHDIVTQCHGGIRVQSEPGQGAVFTICLPRVEEPALAAEQFAPGLAAGGGAETILLAEDEENVRRFLKHLLTGRGYRVLDAVDGRDALRIFEQHSGPIDLLLTDMIMPRMGGRELAQMALSRDPELKVIYVSGYTDDLPSLMETLGPRRSFLCKPLKPDVLASLVRKMLDGSV
jgi:nitrogen-specific signal transduction histidine kinase/CheY-like chemotaxis protein